MITTNAARFRMLVKSPKQLSEWGNMRANSCDAAILASKYCFLAGFDSTSNILANKEFPVIPVEGTYRTFINALPAENRLTTLKSMVYIK
jgi:nicotinate phosphoribosyltransferase